MRNNVVQGDRAMAVLWLTIVALILSAQSASGCRTSLDVPCYTVEMKRSHWNLFNNGITDFGHMASSSVFALRADGSSVTRALDGGKATMAGMYLAPKDQVVTVNHTRRTVSFRETLIWHDRPYRRSTEGDTQCSTGLIHFGSPSEFSRVGSGRIAGVPVVKWTRGSGLLWSEEIHLAPELDCAVLKYSHRRLKSWFGQGFITAFEATSVRIGEPDAELFSLPSGYQQVEDPKRAIMLEFMRRNGR
jgi:hypothetical protein